MSRITSREIRLASRPNGIPTTVVDGIDQAVGAFIGLFHGQNVGRMVVKLI